MAPSVTLRKCSNILGRDVPVVSSAPGRRARWSKVIVRSRLAVLTRAAPHQPVMCSLLPGLLPALLSSSHAICFLFGSRGLIWRQWADSSIALKLTHLLVSLLRSTFAGSPENPEMTICDFSDFTLIFLVQYELLLGASLVEDAPQTLQRRLQAALAPPRGHGPDATCPTAASRDLARQPLKSASPAQLRPSCRPPHRRGCSLVRREPGSSGAGQWGLEACPNANSVIQLLRPARPRSPLPGSRGAGNSPSGVRSVRVRVVAPSVRPRHLGSVRGASAEAASSLTQSEARNRKFLQVVVAL